MPIMRARIELIRKLLLCFKYFLSKVQRTNEHWKKSFVIRPNFLSNLRYILLYMCFNKMSICKRCTYSSKMVYQILFFFLNNIT